MKVVRAVLNGGREETYSNATRLAPTQLPRCRFQQRLRRSDILSPRYANVVFIWCIPIEHPWKRLLCGNTPSSRQRRDT
jgi:hypothetical protein